MPPNLAFLESRSGVQSPGADYRRTLSFQQLLPRMNEDTGAVRIPCCSQIKHCERVVIYYQVDQLRSTGSAEWASPEGRDCGQHHPIGCHPDRVVWEGGEGNIPLSLFWLQQCPLLCLHALMMTGSSETVSPSKSSSPHQLFRSWYVLSQ